MMFDFILLKRSIHWTTKVMFSLSLAVYFLNLQYFIKIQFSYNSKEALNSRTTFENAGREFGPYMYKEYNPVDKSRSNLELYKNPQTLKLQAGRHSLT